MSRHIARYRKFQDQDTGIHRRLGSLYLLYFRLKPSVKMITMRISSMVVLSRAFGAAEGNKSTVTPITTINLCGKRRLFFQTASIRWKHDPLIPLYF